MLKDLIYYGNIIKKVNDEIILAKENVYLVQLDSNHYLDGDSILQGKQQVYKTYPYEEDCFVDISSLVKAEQKSKQKTK